jgi:hypothetical protein
VNTVIEIDEIRQVVHPRPPQRLARPPALPDRFEILARREELRVAIHAGLGRRDAGARQRLNRRVTVAAVDPVITDMVTMRKLHRLLFGHKCLGDVWSAVEV